MKPTDLDLLWELSRPRLSPDGQRIAVSLRRPDLELDAYRGDLWWVRANGSAPPERLTTGHLDADPAWSPDGRWIAFVRAEPRQKGAAGTPQLYLLRVGGGEPVRLTDHLLGVSGAVWSPDSTRIAYLARVPEPGRYGTDERITAREEAPRRVRQLSYKRDLVGYKIDQRRHVFVAPVPDAIGEEPSGGPVQLTTGPFDHAWLDWAPDSQSLVTVSARHEDRDMHLVQDAWVVSVPDGALTRLTDTTLVVARPTFAPDGRRVFFLGYRPGDSGRDTFGWSSALWSVTVDGPAAPHRVTSPGIALPSDRSPDLPSDAVLIVTDDGVVLEQQHRGAVRLVRIDADGMLEVLVDGPREVTGFDVGAECIAASISTDTNCGEVVVVVGGTETLLSDFGREARAKARLFPSEEVDAVAPDGYPLHGFLVRPSGPGPHPLLVFLNGGPFVMAGWKLFDEAQVYAGAGYAVLLTNERGRSGYGEEHGRAVAGRMATLGASDILALTEEVAGRPEFDGDRVAVMGGSYGGFMTSWLVTQTDRFTTAISERALNDWDRSGDIGYYYPDTYIGSTPEAWQAASPIAHADSITTPMLLVHSEEDIDVPLTQAERLFFTLKLRGAEVEMLIFPGEGHDLTRSGLPSHRVARFEALLEWLDRWMKP